MVDKDDFRGIGAHVGTDKHEEMKKRSSTSTTSTASIILEAEVPHFLGKPCHTFLPLSSYDHPQGTKPLPIPRESETRASSPTLGHTLLPKTSPVSSQGPLSPLQAYLDDEERAPVAFLSAQRQATRHGANECREPITPRRRQAHDETSTSLGSSWEHVSQDEVVGHGLNRTGEQGPNLDDETAVSVRSFRLLQESRQRLGRVKGRTRIRKRKTGGERDSR